MCLSRQDYIGLKAAITTLILQTTRVAPTMVSEDQDHLLKDQQRQVTQIKED
jgi:hypothetical protein